MCTHDDHNELKANPERLAAETTPGVPQLDNDGVVLFYWRNHTSCQSSLAVDPETERSARFLVE